MNRDDRPHGGPGNLERWEARWSERLDLELDPSDWLVEQADRLPVGGRALDWAGGDGRHAHFLAARGLLVTLIDIAPTALATAQRRAADRGLTIETRQIDLASEEPPPGPFDLVLCVHHLDRSLPRRAAERLVAGGILVWIQPTVRNLERHERPPARFCLEEGELAELLADYEIVRLEEGWGSEDRHEARAIARWSGPPSDRS